MNNLHTIPNGFERLQQLEILDLSYNFLTEHSFSTEFFTLGKGETTGNTFFREKIHSVFVVVTENLRALYLSDNDMEILSGEIGNLKNLQIVSFSSLSFYIITFIDFTIFSACYSR